MLPSGNDAALAIGRHLTGSDEGFVFAMNTLLHRLGLEDSNFENPHGLDEAGHRASAYDLAMLARYGMTLPEFESVVGETYWTAQGSRTLTMHNGNRLLGSYPDVDGVKTGFTDEAGLTLVASATREGRRLFVVLLTRRTASTRRAGCSTGRSRTTSGLSSAGRLARAPQARVQHVADAVAQQVEGQDGDTDRGCREDRQPGRDFHVLAPRTAQHQPPDGSGGCAPMPRNARPASIRIAAPSSVDIMIRIGAITLGSTCRTMMRSGVAPIVRAAST